MTVNLDFVLIILQSRNELETKIGCRRIVGKLLKQS